MIRLDPRRHRRAQLCSAIALTALLVGPLVAQAPSATVAAGAEDEAATAAATLDAALAAASADVRVYNDHVVTLASPFMEGRLPGTNGMEVAKQYVEFYLGKAGLEPAFDGPAPGEKSWRQAFELGAKAELVSQSLAVFGGEAFEGGVDFNATTAGAGGSAKGTLVFVGYSVESGPDDYATFAEGDDLSGKVALMLRFEPMDEEGKSKWATRAGWSGRAGFGRKLNAVKERNPAAVIIANTPGAADERTGTLVSMDGMGDKVLDVPTFSMTIEAADRLVRASDPQGRSLVDLRMLADAQGGLIPLDAVVECSSDFHREPLVAENVAGVLRGRGALADEVVVVGAHLDHLGTGLFGSRGGSGELHPGADDNASGSAAILMLAERLKRSYDALPEGAPARSLLLMCFSAEESGLNGARHYANNPIAPIEQHALMINFDMIGRIKDKRLSVSGTNSAEGLQEWLQPFFDASPLEIVAPENMSGASDHTAFYQKQVPVLFGIIADFHGDYHTPADTSDKINREDAVRTIDLFHEIVLAAGTRPEPFVYKEVPRRARRPRATADASGDASGDEAPSGGAGARLGGIRVRVGIMPGSYIEGEAGVLVGDVTPGGSAEEAGVEAGDRLVKWNGETLGDVSSWMEELRKHAPGDKVQVTVLRDGEEKVLWMTLQAREEGGG